jgi:hypothetical protein
MKRMPTLTAYAGGAFLVISGVWALLAPRSFYDAVATYPPYNRHLIHDIGAFMTGLGAGLFAGLRLRRAVTVALVANAVAAVAHEISHIVDRNEGGKTSDPITIGVIAVVFVVAAVIALREDKKS